MATWHFDDGPVNIGIDIGWSERKKSCAVAVEGLSVGDGIPDWTPYRGVGRPIAVGLFRFRELEIVLPQMIRSVGPQRDHTTVVVDGPIGRTGLATTNRMVDTEFGRDVFYGRMQPSAVASGSGPKYAGVTDCVVRMLYEAAALPYRPAWWDGRQVHGFTCCETHPTVGLALLLPPQHVERLPSRRSPRRMAAQAPYVRAKSDWYWQLGAGNWVEEILMCPSVAEEVHHERVAALYCLAVANRLAAHRTELPTCAAIGDEEGVYVVPSVVHSEWDGALRKIGIHRGQISPRDQSRYLVGAVPVEVATFEVERAPTDEPDDVERDDSVTLMLTDNGGVWEKHNDWLTGLEPPVCVMSDDAMSELIQLRRARGPGMWSSTNERQAQTPLDLARRRGFGGDHLTLANPWRIFGVLKDCAD